MSFGIAARAFAVWIVILIAAVVNGALREVLLIPELGDVSGLVISGLLLSLLILAAAYLFLPWLSSGKSTELLFIGIGWLMLTLTFEFSFGLLRGKALNEILAAYTFKDGNIWPVVLIVTAAAPWLAAGIRKWR